MTALLTAYTARVKAQISRLKINIPTTVIFAIVDLRKLAVFDLSKNTQ